MIANKRNILGKKVYMRINRSEKCHRLIRKIVCFKDKDYQVINSKISYFSITLPEKFAVTEEVEYINSSYGKSKSQKSFDKIKKVFF